MDRLEEIAWNVCVVGVIVAVPLAVVAFAYVLFMAVTS